MSKRTVIAGVLAGALFVSAGLAVEQIQFRGRMFTGNSAAPTATIKIVYEGLSTQEDLAEIYTALATSGTQAMIQRMMKTKIGNIQFVGGTGLRIDLYMAFEKKNEKGMTLFLVSESQKADPNSSRFVFANDNVLVLQLDLDEKMNGEGKIMEDAVIKFSAGGEFEIVSYRTTPKMIVNIRKQ